VELLLQADSFRAIGAGFGEELLDPRRGRGVKSLLPGLPDRLALVGYGPFRIDSVGVRLGLASFIGLISLLTLGTLFPSRLGLHFLQKLDQGAIDIRRIPRQVGQVDLDPR